jgi:hypothetical protein
MKRNEALKVLNPILGLLALSQILTGVLRGFLTRETFLAVHRATGLAFAAAALLHVVLNWNWIKASYFKGKVQGGG